LKHAGIRLEEYEERYHDSFLTSSTKSLNQTDRETANKLKGSHFKDRSSKLKLVLIWQ
jgi:hypothetical protein